MLLVARRNAGLEISGTANFELADDLRLAGGAGLPEHAQHHALGARQRRHRQQREEGRTRVSARPRAA